MKSIRIHAYGGADAMQLEDAPVPECGASDLLVRVVAAGVNPIDWKIRSGAMAQGAERRFPFTLGWVAAGTVAATGGAVTGFKSGDEVCFYAEFARGGCYAECVAVDASQVALKPRTMSFVQVVCDACGSGNPIAEEMSWRRMERAGVRLTGTNAIVAELVRNWASPAGAVAFPLLTT
jgi:NADPH:quinone reductase-like Zn-dependent oxidoreductase